MVYFCVYICHLYVSTFKYNLEVVYSFRCERNLLKSAQKFVAFRLRSFGVIWIRISDARSVWIMVHQRNRRIHCTLVIDSPVLLMHGSLILIQITPKERTLIKRLCEIREGMPIGCLIFMIIPHLSPPRLS